MTHAVTVLLETTIEGVSYVLYAEGVIVVRDVEADQLVTRVDYPSLTAASLAYAETVKLAHATA